MLRTLAVIALLGFAAPAFAQSDADVDATINQVLGDPAPYHEAFDAIQAAVNADDAATFAKWVEYPIKVTADGEAMTIATPEQFAAHFDAIVTGDISQTVTDQTWATLFVNDQGIMFGNGEVWLNGLCKDAACSAVDVRVITIQSTEQ